MSDNHKDLLSDGFPDQLVGRIIDTSGGLERIQKVNDCWKDLPLPHPSLVTLYASESRAPCIEVASRCIGSRIFRTSFTN